MTKMQKEERERVTHPDQELIDAALNCFAERIDLWSTGHVLSLLGDELRAKALTPRLHGLLVLLHTLRNRITAHLLAGFVDRRLPEKIELPHGEISI
jgi:hypothetical protein